MRALKNTSASEVTLVVSLPAKSLDAEVKLAWINETPKASLNPKPLKP